MGGVTVVVFTVTVVVSVTVGVVDDVVTYFPVYSFI